MNDSSFYISSDLEKKINVGRKKKITTPPRQFASLADFDQENATPEIEPEKDAHDLMENNADNEVLNDERFFDLPENAPNFDEVDAGILEKIRTLKV